MHVLLLLDNKTMLLMLLLALAPSLLILAPSILIIIVISPPSDPNNVPPQEHPDDPWCKNKLARQCRHPYHTRSQAKTSSPGDADPSFCYKISHELGCVEPEELQPGTTVLINDNSQKCQGLRGIVKKVREHKCHATVENKGRHWLSKKSIDIKKFDRNDKEFDGVSGELEGKIVGAISLNKWNQLKKHWTENDCRMRQGKHKGRKGKLDQATNQMVCIKLNDSEEVLVKPDSVELDKLPTADQLEFGKREMVSRKIVGLLCLKGHSKGGGEKGHSNRVCERCL